MRQEVPQLQYSVPALVASDFPYLEAECLPFHIGSAGHKRTCLFSVLIDSTPHIHTHSHLNADLR